MDTAVAVRGLGITKVFGDVVALDHVDVNVPRGFSLGIRRARSTSIAVRELAPVVSPLEAAFLALTEQPNDEPNDEPNDHDHEADR